MEDFLMSQGIRLGKQGRFFIDKDNTFLRKCKFLKRKARSGVGWIFRNENPPFGSSAFDLDLTTGCLCSHENRILPIHVHGHSDEMVDLRKSTLPVYLIFPGQFHQLLFRIGQNRLLPHRPVLPAHQQPDGNF